MKYGVEFGGASSEAWRNKHSGAFGAANTFAVYGALEGTPSRGAKPLPIPATAAHRPFERVAARAGVTPSDVGGDLANG